MADDSYIRDALRELHTDVRATRADVSALRDAFGEDVKERFEAAAKHELLDARVIQLEEARTEAVKEKTKAEGEKKKLMFIAFSGLVTIVVNAWQAASVYFFPPKHVP